MAATLHAMADITADPNVAIDASIAQAPNLATADKAHDAGDPQGDRRDLVERLHAWPTGPGAIDRSAWQKTADFMVGLKDGTVASAPPIDQLGGRQPAGALAGRGAGGAAARAAPRG